MQKLFEIEKLRQAVIQRLGQYVSEDLLDALSNLTQNNLEQAQDALDLLH